MGLALRHDLSLELVLILYLTMDYTVQSGMHYRCFRWCGRRPLATCGERLVKKDSAWQGFYKP